jgi:hypothetical protein
MKSYKLIKGYPGLLDAGSVATWGTHALSGVCYQVNVPGNIYRFGSKTIEDNPEFWEKIPEKPYEILSFSGKVTESEYHLDRIKGCFTNKALHSKFSAEELVNHGCKISSVKRLSDGEVFARGEKIIYSNKNPTSFLEGCEIHYFSIMDGKAFVNSHFGDRKCNGLEDVIHYVPERDSSCKILSFIWRGTGKGTLANVQKDGGYSSYPVNSRTFGGSTLSSMLAASSWDIHSVERLSDKKVFTLDDLITHVDNPWAKKVTIASFKSKEEGTLIDIKNNFGGQHAIANLNKQVPPLFVTEDGVNVLPGDEPYWVVTRKDRMHLIDYRGACANHNRILSISDIYKTFSTKEAADSYIAKNKILFVTEDGVNITQGATLYWLCVSKDTLNDEFSFDKYDWKGTRSTSGSYKWFSSKEAVMTYLLKVEPLFTSEDGVEIFTGDEIFYIRDTRSYSKINIHNVIACNGSASSSAQGKNVYFSSMKAAQNHVDKNIPKFSINDIEAVCSEREDLGLLIECLQQRASNAH